MNLRYFVFPALLLMLFSGCTHLTIGQQAETASSTYPDETSDKSLHNGQFIERTEGQASELVEERRQQLPYKDRRIRVAVDLTRNRAQFVVSDDGAGFDLQTKLPKSADEAMETDGGRGLVLIQAFMNEVIFNETGNEMRMTLKDLTPMAQ